MEFAEKTSKIAYFYAALMSAQIIDGKALSERLRLDIRAQTLRLTEQGCQPGLAVVMVGEDPASAVYVRNKVTACEAVGFYSEHHVLPANCTEVALLDLIAQLNADARLHGILVQLPLPSQINSLSVLAAIAPHKDVDGFHESNIGALVTGHPRFIPCTPYGVMQMLSAYNVPIPGAQVVVIGASNIVGKPMALLLLARGATVSICHARTRDVSVYTREADIVIVAAGCPGLLQGAMIKEGAVVIDVGINRLPDGRLVGDADWVSCVSKASLITPVPGGVGPMTIAMLLQNTLEAAERTLSRDGR